MPTNNPLANISKIALALVLVLIGIIPLFIATFLFWGVGGTKDPSTIAKKAKSL